jgi:hypothetical protein
MAPSESHLFAAFEAAFASVTAPPERVAPHRCYECDGINEFLAGVDRNRLSIGDAISVFGHSQLHLLSGRALQYYFPAMVRAALSSTEAGEGFLADLLYFLAEGDGEKLQEFSPEQWDCVSQFLQFVRASRGEVIATYAHEPELERAIQRWSTAA